MTIRPIHFLMMRASSIAALLIAVLCLALAIGAGGCAGGSGPAASPARAEGGSEKLNAWLASQSLDVASSVYRVGPPDKLKVVAPGVKEIDGQEVVVRSDGKISLNLIGEMSAAGKTPAEISEEMAQSLAKYYKAESIDISVQVKEFKSKVFYVFGQVIQPGVKAYTGRDTVLAVIAAAKLNAQAWPQKIVIVRPNEDVSIKQRVTVDLKEMYETGKVSHNFLIEEGDVVYVPPSPLAEASMTFKKLLFPIIPATNLAMLARGGI